MRPTQSRKCVSGFELLIGLNALISSTSCFMSQCKAGDNYKVVYLTSGRQQLGCSSLRVLLILPLLLTDFDRVER